jgi:hypothetical protein
MKRAPIILAGTVAGVVGIVGYHTATPSTAAGVAGDGHEVRFLER